MANSDTEGALRWVTDLSAVAADTAHPSLATAGIAVPDDMRHGARVHISLDVTADDAPSLSVPVYGYDGTTWRYLGSLNDGTPIGVNAATWSPTATSIRLVEVFIVAPMNYKRLAARVVGSAGTNRSVTTRFGFPVG